MDHLFVCVMAGGSGERFWPLSRKSTAKHLLRLFSDRALIEETVRRVEKVIPAERIFILTNRTQLAETRQILSFLPPEQIIAEPASRDTAPACALGTALIRARDPQAVVAFLPADHLIQDVDTFARQLREAATVALDTDALVAFSIQPTYAGTGFGYLKLGQPVLRSGLQTKFFQVERFVEKPDAATAETYLADKNYGWNAGMFLWRSDVFLQQAEAHCPALAQFVNDFVAAGPKANAFLDEAFPLLPKISIDYALMEKAANVIAGKSEFDWDDVGCWTALPAHLPADEQGNTTRGEVVQFEATNNIVYAQKKVIALCGVKDLVVVETDDAILVCHRDHAQQIKKLHAKLPPRLH